MFRFFQDVNDEVSSLLDLALQHRAAEAPATRAKKALAWCVGYPVGVAIGAGIYVGRFLASRKTAG